MFMSVKQIPLVMTCVSRDHMCEFARVAYVFMVSLRPNS